MSEGIFINEHLNNKRFYLIGYNKVGKKVFCSSDKKGNIKFSQSEVQGK